MTQITPDDRNAKLPPHCSSDKSGYQSPQHSKGPFPYVRDLPPEAEAALNKVGIKEIAFLAAVGYDGRMRVLKPKYVQYFEGFPVEKVRVKTLGPIAILGVEGSDCIVVANGSVGEWVEAIPKEECRFQDIVPQVQAHINHGPP